MHFESQRLKSAAPPVSFALETSLVLLNFPVAASRENEDLFGVLLADRRPQLGHDFLRSFDRLSVLIHGE